MASAVDSSKVSASAGNETTRASLELLYEIGREVAAALDLRTVLHRLLFLSMKSVGATSGSIVVLDEQGQPVESAFLQHGQTHHQTSLQLRVTYEQGMAGWVARHKQAVLVPDTSLDERWLLQPDDARQRSGPKSAVSAPILAGENMVGVITLVHPSLGFFTSDHLDLLKAIADQAGTAIRNAQLYQQLEETHQRYRELFEDSIDPILVTDREGRILEANRRAEAIIGFQRKVLHSSSIGDLHKIDWDKVGPKFNKLEAKTTVSYESVLHSHLGRDIPIQVYVRSISSGGDIQLQWILRDLTERKELDNLREDLIAMVYHDLRSPLMNILSSLEVLSSMTPFQDDATARSLLHIALRSTERIQRLTSALLDINRLEAGQTVGPCQLVSPASLVQEALEVTQFVANTKKMEMVVDLPADLPQIFVDADVIRRVLINLIENAVKFTSIGGRIQIGARQENGFVLFWVTDSGLGIPLAEQERIFDKFTRLQTAEGTKGLGLGLAFCRLAVAGHGGRIWVESEAGEGATFKFAVPLVHETGP